MKKTDLFGDAVDSRSLRSEEDFRSLFESSAGPGRDLKVGDSFEGEILSIGKEESFVSTGTTDDAQIPTLDLKDKNGALLYKVGDKLKVRVVRTRDGEILVKRTDSVSSGADDVDSLEDAFDLELPVKGKVTEAVKGGFRVEMHGKKAFCPFSQIDLRAANDPAEYLGKSFEFIITQHESRNLVVSRRKVLELQRAEGEGAFMLSRKPGDKLQGTITKIEKFGAFCRLEDGVEGLIPVSELAWGRVSDPHEVVRVGQSVSVVLMRVTEEGDRLRVSLSLKQGGDEGDPWMQVPQIYPVGTITDGTVERKEAYGLFVNIAPGVTGLMPRSKWRDVIDGSQYENKKKGERLKVMISEVNFEEKRLTLSPPTDVDDGAWRAHAGGGSAGGASAGTAKKGFGTLGDMLQPAKASQTQSARSTNKK